jgi:hypothetical protein
MANLSQRKVMGSQPEVPLKKLMEKDLKELNLPMADEIPTHVRAHIQIHTQLYT